MIDYTSTAGQPCLRLALSAGLLYIERRMEPRTQTPATDDPPGTPAPPPETETLEKLNERLDEELDETFPASDPIPYNHSDAQPINYLDRS